MDKYSTIVVYQNHYSVPDIFVGKQLDIRIYSHRIVVYNDRNIIATHERSFKLRDWRIDIYHYLRTLKRKKGALPQSTALLQADTKIKNIYNRYYNADAHMFLEILEIIKEQGVDAVEKALHRLELLSPLDMSSDKVRVLCDTQKDLWSPGTDSISEKAKSTLAKYDQLRVLQTQINLRDKVVAL